ncbi:MAG: hypothetical protein K2R98_00180 [Gemmataceae bacterium]|nr:hypothetical protein [Gemmataceae bacterium]
MLFDHTYETIKALQGLGIYELRLDDVIGGQSNIRVVFFDPPKGWEPVPEHEKPMRALWVLEALPKKRNDWTDNELTRFRTSRVLLQKRCYS